jgi:putative transposase
MTEKDNWRSARSVVYKNTVHLVFVTKYRKPVFTNALLLIVESIMSETCAQMNSELIEFNGEGNHVHIMASVHPKYSLSNFVGKLKGKSSYVLRRDHFDEIKSALWGSHFWSPSYCAVSTGRASIEVVTEYIKNQARPR